MQAKQQMSQANFSSTEGLKYSVAAFSSSFCVQLLHPLDIVKTRLQSHDGGKITGNLVPQYKGIRHAVSTIYYEEGMKGLYKGFVWTLFAQSVSRILFFTLYEQGRNIFETTFTQSTKDFQIFLASTTSGIIATFITTPMWILKTRMLLNTSSISEIQNLKGAVISIFRDHGTFGFWRGLSVSLPLCLHGTIQMSVFEKVQQITRKGAKYDTYNIRAAVSGLVSKFAAIIVTYPLQTLRTRIQQNQYFGEIAGSQQHKQPKYKNIRDILIQLQKKEGLLSLYKGLKPSLIMNLTSNSIYFYCYEQFKRLLGVSRDYSEISSSSNKP